MKSFLWLGKRRLDNKILSALYHIYSCLVGVKLFFKVINDWLRFKMPAGKYVKENIILLRKSMT